MHAGVQASMRVSAHIDAMADALAAHVQSTLANALTERGRAALVVSGGSTPARYLPRIAACSLDWSRVSITLADDRWVDPADGASNERLVREHLLVGNAARAHFVALKNPAPTPQAGAGAADQALGTIVHPYDLVLLGMGDDGHIASLFPGAPELPAALDRTASMRCMGITPPAYARPAIARISMTLGELVDARSIALVIQGAAKREALAEALAHGDAARAPVCALFAAAADRVEVFWAP